MIDLATSIMPYVGTGIFKLDSSPDEIKTLLKEYGVLYNEEINVNRYNPKDPPWIIVEIDNVMELFFAKNRLFKIVLKGIFSGNLPNGINLDTTIDDAQKIDPNLIFDDWDEIYTSTNGYWVEYDEDTKKLCWIAIFIPALERDDFFEYKW
ncbi:MAG: hypothetical protein IJ685_07570 [Selenomonadaceae bacterium]|nr:hypothetical protein [Selenomonadaceae bacterium]